MKKLLFKKIVDNRNPKSFANKMRRRRFALFQSLIDVLPRPLKILDAGGTEAFWAMMGWKEERDLQIVLLNLLEIQVSHQSFKSVVGDVRNMSQFKKQEFDIVFSNSVLQYARDFSNQVRMANEIRRVGKRYFLQTPNRYFPIEPHFFFPFFQFLPLAIKVWLITHFDMGNYTKIADKQESVKVINAIRLLSKKELKSLFPDAIFFEEKFLGLSKSFIVYEGW